MAISSASIEKTYLHPAIEVYSGGWRSDIATLQRHGWRFNAAHDPTVFAVRILAKNPHVGLVGSFMVDDRHMPMRAYSPPLIYLDERMVLTADVGIAKELHIPKSMVIAPAEVAIPMTPDLTEWRTFSPDIDDGPAEIVVTPEKIPMLLDEIRKAQEPQARELLHRQRKRNELKELKTKAKILAFG